MFERPTRSVLAMLFLLLILILPLAYAQVDYPSANLNTTWVNNGAPLQFADGSRVRPILLRSPGSGIRYSFGFYCTDPSLLSPCDDNAYLLAIFIVQTDSIGLIKSPYEYPRAVWYANRNHLVGENATLAFTSTGDLSLSDADGTPAWSTNTFSKGVHALSLQPTGNLILTNAQNSSIWQSFDYPADILVLGQKLGAGIRLIASTYFNNSTQGPYYMQMERTGLTLYIDDPVTPQPYWSAGLDIAPSKMLDIPYAVYGNGSLDLFISNLTNPDYSVPIPPTPAQSLSYLQMEADGKIRVYSWLGTYAGNWTMLVDLQVGSEKTCSMPTICGPYGICDDGNCSCLSTASANGSQPADNFSQVVSTIRSLGCTFYPPLVCNASTATTHHFLRLDNYYYPATTHHLDNNYNLNFYSLPYKLNGSMPIMDCQQRCLQNCSCMAALFLFTEENETLGTCCPISKLYTITSNAQDSIPWKSVVLIRTQSLPQNATLIPPASIVPPPQALTPQQSPARPSVNLTPPHTLTAQQIPTRPSVNLAAVLSAVLSSVTVAGLLLLGSIFVYRRRPKRRAAEEDMFEAVPNLIPTRFSFKELKVATKNFSKKLGSGGFGSVFLGALTDGSEVAVKRLESANQGQKEFRTEVCIIGSIHHVNLVRLRGFCAEKEHRLLVYEYMPKGSLEKWLFRRTNNQGASNDDDDAAAAAAADDDDDAGNNYVLDWGLRFNIALGTARGLAYLHEECSERIIHLDIKPPNILLDDHFVAKVSDFGLSKLMNRDQSRVMTTMRGTPGYLAPEWLHAGITEKADVYSFGILLFEIASGRKSVDMSVEESEVRHIPVWASRMVEEGRLMDMIDARLLQEFNREQAKTMVKVALWCVQEIPAKRPSMGTVVQMLEAVVECPDPPLNDSNLLNTVNHYTHKTFTSIDSQNVDNAMESNTLASIISGPR